jgi:putative transposase
VRPWWEELDREALVIEVDSGIKGEQVVDVVSRITAVRGAPRSIRVDNGPEFVSKALDQWAQPAEAHAMRSIVGRQAERYGNGVTLDFSRPGKPTDNALNRVV